MKIEKENKDPKILHLSDIKMYCFFRLLEDSHILYQKIAPSTIRSGQSGLNMIVYPQGTVGTMYDDPEVVPLEITLIKYWDVK